jgi:hypothetical protein
MPFKSERQRRFMWAHHPAIASRWAHERPARSPSPKHDLRRSPVKHGAGPKR